MNTGSKIPKLDVDEGAFFAAVEEIRAGKLDRAGAAARLGMKQTTFQTWLRRHKLLDGLKHTKKSSRPRPDMSSMAPETREQYAAALREAGEGTESVLKISRKYPLVNYQVLARKVRESKRTPA